MAMTLDMLVLGILGRNTLILSSIRDGSKKQAGAELCKAQLKLELGVCFASFKICCIKLIKLVRMYQLSRQALIFISSIFSCGKLFYLTMAFPGDSLPSVVVE